MKIFGFYISRTDWETKSINQLKWNLYLNERIAKLEIELQKYQRPRDKSGRFISKSDNLHQQMRNYYNKPTDYAALKEAIMQKEFGR